MSKAPRKTGVLNLVVGIILVFLGIGAMVSILNASSSSLASSIGFILLFVFVGGYEIGKYSENRQSKVK